MKKVYLLLVLCLLSLSGFATNWYTLLAGTGDATLYTNWTNSSTGVGGSTPASAAEFLVASDTWNIISNGGGTFSMGTSGNWHISGNLVLSATGNANVCGTSSGTPITGGFQPNNGTTVTIDGNLTLQNSAIFSTSQCGAGDVTVNVGGNVTVSNTAFFFNASPTGWSHLNFTNTSSTFASPQTVTWTSTSVGEYYNFVVNSNVFVQLLTNVTLPTDGDAANVVNGTLNLGGFTLNCNTSGFGGNQFNVPAGGTVYTANANGMNAISAPQGFNVASGNIVFNGSVGQNAGTNPNMPLTMLSGSNVTINNGSTGVTFQQNETFNSGSTLTWTQGRIAIGTGNTLTLNGNMSGVGTSALNCFAGSATSNLNLGGANPLNGGSLFMDQSVNGTSNNISTLTLNGSYSNINLGNNLWVGTALNLTSDGLGLNGQTLTLNNSTFSGSASNFLTGSATSTLTISGAGSLGTLFFNETTPGTTNAVCFFNNNRAGVTTTLGNNMAVACNLNLAAGTLADNGNTITVSGDISGTATHSGTGQILMTGSGTTISGAILGNLQISSGGIVSLAGSPTINGNLTLTSGVLDATGLNYNIIENGNWTNNASAGAFVPRTGLVSFNGTSGAQNIGGTFSTNFYNLNDNNSSSGGILNLNTNANIANQLFVNTGAEFYPAPAVVINSSGAVGTVTGTGTGTIDVSRVTVVADLVNQYKFAAYTLTGLTTNYDGIGNQTIDATGGAISNYGTLATSQVGTKTLGGAINVNTKVSIGSGTILDVSSSNYQITDFGSWTNSGGFTAESGLVAFAAITTNTITGSTSGSNQFNNISFTATSGTPSWSFAGASFGVTGNFTINSSCTVIAPGSAYNLTIGGSYANSGTFSNNGGTVIMNGAGTLAGNMTSALSSSFNNLIFNATGIYSFSNNADIANNFTINTGSVTAPAILNIAGNWANNATFTHNGGTVNMTAASGSHTLSGNMTASTNGAFNNLNFSGAGNWIFNNPADLAGKFTQSLGAVTAPSGNLNIGQSAGVGFSQTGGTFNPNGGTVTFNGTSASISATGATPMTIPGTNSFNNLSFAATSATQTYTLNNAIWVIGNLSINANSWFQVTTGVTLSVGGNWSNLGQYSAGVGNTVFMVGTSGSLTLAGNMTGTNKFTNLTFKGDGIALGANWAFSNAADIGGNLSMNWGQITAPSGALNIAGNYTINNTASFVNNGGTVNMNATGAVTATLGGTGTMTGSNRFNNLTFTGTNGSTAFNINNPADVGGNFTIAGGTVTAPSGTLQIAGNYSNNAGGTFTANGGTLTMNGAIGALTMVGNMSGTSSFNNLNFSGGASWNLTGATGGNVTALGSVNITSGTVTAPAGTFAIGGSYANAGTFTSGSGTVNMTGTGSLSGGMTGSNKFNNLTFSGTTYSFGSNADIGGNLNITSGTVTAPSGTLQIAGSYTNGGVFTNAGGTVVFNGTTGGTLNTNMTGTSAFNNLTFNGTGSWAITNNITANGNFTITSGTLTAPGSAFTFIVGGSWANNGTFNNNTGTVNMTGSGTLSGNLTGTNRFNNLTFSNNGAWTFMAVSADLAGNYSQTGGTVTAPSTNLNVGGNFSKTGATATFVPNGGTVTMNGGSSSVAFSGPLVAGTNSFNNLSFNASAASTVYLVTTPLLLTGNFNNMTANARISLGTNNVTVGGNWNNTGTIDAGTGTVTMNGTTTSLLLSGNMTAATNSKFNNLTFNGVGGAWSFAGSSADAGGNFVITNGQVTAPSSTLQIAGNYSNAGTFVNNGGTVNMNGTTGGAGITLSGAMTGANKFNNLNFNGVGGVSGFSNSADVAGNFSIQTGSSVLSNSNTLQIGGNYLNNGAFTSGTGTVVMNGTSGSLTLSGTPVATAMTGANAFYNLTFNGGASWSFGSIPVTVNNSFNIISGTVSAPSTTLTVLGSYNNNGSFVNGGGTVQMGNCVATGNLTLSGSMTGSNKFNNLTLAPVATYSCTFNAASEVGGNYSSACGGTIVAPSTNLFIDGGFAQTAGNFNPNGGTLNFTPSTSGSYALNLTGMNTTGLSWINNLTFNGTGSTWTFAPANSFDVNGNFTITNGTVVAPLSQTITVGGNWANNGTFTANNGVVTMNGTTSGLTISGSMTGANKFNNLIFNGIGGTWSFGSSAADVGGFFTITNGTVIAPSTNLNVGGSWLNNGTFTNNSGTVTMNGAGAFTLSGSMAGATNRFNNLVFNNAGGAWTINSPLDAAGNFTLTNGTVTLSASPVNILGNFSTATGTTFNAGANSIFAGGSWNSLGTFNANTSSVTMNGAGSFSIGGNPVFWNLTFNNAAGNWSFGSSSATVLNNFNIIAGDVTAPSSTLTIGNNYSNTGSFANNGGTVNMNGNGAIITLTGSMTGANKFNNLTFSGSGGYTFGSNSADVGGNLLISNGTLTAPGPGFALQVAGSWTNNSALASSFVANSGLVTMNASSGAYTIGGTANMVTNPFFDLAFDGGGSWSFGSTQVQVNDKFNIISGTVTAPSSTLFLGGASATSTFTNSGSFVNNGGTVQMNNTGVWTFTGNFTGTNSFFNFTENSGTTKFTTNADLGGNFTNNGGTFQAPPGNLNIAGNFVENSGTFNPNNGTVTMNGTSGAITMTTSGMNSVGTSSFYNLTFNGSGSSAWTWPSATSFAVGNNFTISGGSVTAPSGQTITVGGNWYNGGSFVHNGGTVAMTSGLTGRTLGGSMTGVNAFNNLSFNGSGAWSFGSSAADVAGNFSITGGTVTAPSSLLQVGGNWSNTGGLFANNGGIVNMNGTGTISAANASGVGSMTGSNAFNNLTFNNPGGTWLLNSNIDVAGYFTVTNGTVTGNTGGTRNIGGNFTIAAGGTYNAGAGAVKNVGGSWLNLGVYRSNATSSTNMNGSGANTMSGLMTTPNNFANLSFTGTGSWTFGANADVSSNFTVSSGDVIAPAGNLNVGGNFTNGGGTFTNNSGTVTMNGAGTTQNFNALSTGSFIAPNAFYNLVFNGTAASQYNVNSRLTAANNFTNNSGTVNTLGNSITVGGNFSNVNATSIFNNNAATDTLFVGGNFNNNGTFTAGLNGTVNMTGPSGPYVLTGNLVTASAFNNLIFTGGGAYSFGNRSATANNLFNIISGTVTAPSALAPTGLTIGDAAGTFSNSGNFLNNGGTVTFTSTVVTANAGSLNGNMTGADKFNNVVFNGTPATTYTFNAPADIAGNYTQSSGNVVAPSGNLNVAGYFSESATAALGNFNPNGGTVTMNASTGAIADTLNNMNNLGTSDFYNLVFNGGSSAVYTIYAPSGFTVSNNFNNIVGTVLAPAATISVGGNWSNTGVYNSNTGAAAIVNMYGSGTLGGNLTVASNGSFNNLTFSNTGTYAFTTANADVTGVYLQNGSGTVVAPSGVLNVAGGTTSGVTIFNHAAGVFNPNGGTVTFNGALAAASFNVAWGGTPITGNSFNNLTFNPSATETFNLQNNLLITGNFLNNVAASTVNAAVSGGITLTVGGNWTNNGVFAPGTLGAGTGSTVLMNGTTGGLELGGSTVPATFYNLTFNGVGGAWTMNSTTTNVANNFTVTNGDVTAPTVNLNIGANFSNSVGGTSIFNAEVGSTVTMTNATGVALGLLGIMTGTSSFYNLTFSGNGGNTYTFGAGATVQNNWLNSTGTVNAGNFIYNIGGNYTNSGSFNCGQSTINMNGSGAPGPYTMSGNMTAANEFYNLIFNGGVYVIGSNASTIGNFTINSGTVTAPNILTIGDQITTTTTSNFTNWGNFISGAGTGSTNTVFMQGASGTNNMIGNMTGSNRFNFLTFNSPSQTYTFGSYPAEIYRDYLQNLNAVVTAPTTTLTIWGSFLKSSNGNFNHNGGSVIMQGGGVATAPQMNTVGMTASGFNNLTFNGVTGVTSWSWTTPLAFLVSGNFTINGGQVTAPQNQTITCSKSWTNNGVFTHNNCTVNMNGTSTSPPMYLSGNMTQVSSTSSVTANSFFNLTFSGTGLWEFANNADLGSTLTQTNGTVVAPAVLSVGGNFVHTAGAFNPNVPMNGTVIFDAGLGGSAGGNSIAAAGCYSVTVTGVTMNTFPSLTSATLVSCFNNIVFKTSTAGIAWEVGATAGNNLAIYGNVAIYSGTVTAGYIPLSGGSSPVWTVDGSWLNTGVFNANTGTVNFNGFTPGLTLNGNMTTATHGNFNNVTFQGVGAGGQYTFDTAADIQGVLTIGIANSLSAGPTVIAPATTLTVYGNFLYHNGTFLHNNGTVTMGGTGTSQQIGGTPLALSTSNAFAGLTFNNLVVNNSSGVTIGSGTVGIPETVNGTLTVQSGRLTVGNNITSNNNLILGPAASAISPGTSGSFSFSNMIVEHTANTTNSRVLKMLNAASGPYLFPIGDTVTNSYSPITLNVTGTTFAAGAYVGVNEYPKKDPHNANTTNFLNRYWYVTMDSISVPVYSATATYVASDVTGAENKLSAGQYGGALPWLKFGPTNAATHTLTFGAVGTATSEFTGIDSTRPTVTDSTLNHSQTATICFGQSTKLFYTPGAGDGPLTYSWAPAAYLSSTFGDTVIATPPVTTVFTVTVTDGNGFIGQAYATVNVNPLPNPITGVTTVCTGSTTLLSVTPGGGVWGSGDNFQATVTASGGLVSGLAAGTPFIYYTLPTGCYDSTQVTVNPSPAGISGTPNVCVGLNTTLGDATPGGNWLSTSAIVTVLSSGSTATVTGNSAGVTTITYQLPGTLCQALRTFTVNANPTVFNVTGGGGYCAGGTGVPVGLSGSSNGIRYDLFNTSVLAGTETGTFFGGALNFGNQTVGGNYTVVATNPTTSCVSNMTGVATVTVNPLPIVDTLSSGGSYCAGGAGISMSLNTSTPGVSYQLYEDGIASGSAVAGTSSSISFGNRTVAGNYTAAGTDTLTGCSNNMFGVAPVIVNPNPEVYNVTGGGGFCAGGTGVHVGLDFSDPGVNYELKINGINDPASITLGASSVLDFNLQTAGGVYTAFATNTSNGCTSTMTGSVVVTVEPLPTPFTVGRSAASYCAGTTGVSITVNPTNIGTRYQLINSDMVLGDTIQGTSSMISFTNETLAGYYNVQAINDTTGCVNMMADSVQITINPAPIAEVLSGTGSYCSGGTGVNIMLNNSQTGVKYYVYNNSTLLPGSTAGDNLPLSLGSETLAGVYKAVGTYTATGCSNNMLDSAIVTINPLPTVYPVTGAGGYCANAAAPHIGLSYSDIGVNYSLLLGSSIVGGPIAGSNASIDFGVQAAAGTYSVVATNAVTGCMKTMGTPVVIMNAIPTRYVVGASASSYCIGGAGIHITLDHSASGFTYMLMNGSTTEGILLGGGGSLDFGYLLDSGNHIVTSKNNTTGCIDTMAGSAPIAINQLPTPYPVTGGGSYCAGGTGVIVGMSNSDTGVSYRLLSGTGATVMGNASGITFGAQTVAGVYKVQATNLATTCVNIMADSAIVIINPLPTVYNITGGGGYCAGSGGSEIDLTGSDLEVSYQVYAGTVADGLPVMGTGGTLNLGDHTVTGDYTVIGTNLGSLCASTMSGTVPVSINPLPRPYTVLGGGSYCVGGIGVIDSLSGSDLGVNYILYLGSTPIDTMSGNGGVMNYGYKTAAGVYNVVGYDVTTGCRSNMIYADTITINSLPVSYTLTGGGNYCTGGSGVHVGVFAGVIGVNYQLYRDTSVVGAPVSGDGLPLDFGFETVPGTYHAVGRSVITGCSNLMADSVSVGIAPTVIPAVNIHVPGGDTVCSGSTIMFMANPVNGGVAPTYSWNVNGTYEGAGDTLSYIPHDGDNVTVTMSSNAACAFPLTGTKTIVMTVHNHELPIAVITATPGTSVCPGTAVTFNSTSAYGGTSPQYFWVVNNVFNSGAGSFTYAPGNRDYVILMMISNYPCRLMDTVFSNDIVMSVDTLTPSVTITANPGQNITRGQYVTLTANPMNAGSKPTYQWFVNGGILASDTTNMLTSNQFVNGDSVTCMMTTGGGACSGITVYNSIKISVNGNVGVGNLATGGSLRVSPNPNKGAFSIIGSLGTATDETVSIDITDMLGQTVYTGTLPSKKGNVNAKVNIDNVLANGVYLLTLHSDSGTTILHMVIEQ